MGRGRWLLAMSVGVVTFVGGSAPGLAATQASVDCGAGGDLQAAINAAKPGTIISVSGTCHGAFTVGKNLVLKGVPAAVLDGQLADTTLTVTKGKVRVTRMTITGGEAVEAGGGIRNAGALTLTRVHVDGNVTGEVAAGVYNEGTISIERSTVSQNHTRDVGGQGIWNKGTMTIDHSTVDNNPGGILNFTGATLSMFESTLSRNHTCPEPGGLWNAGTAMIRYSTIEFNSSCNSRGGGILNAGTITIVGSTIAFNTADEGGGGLLNSGTATIAGTIIAGNDDPSGLSSDCEGTIASQGYNLIGSDFEPGLQQHCSITSTPTDQIGGEDPIDAMLKTLSNYGGPTQTSVPRPPSPAVNAIPTGATTADGATPLCPVSGTTDQRGIPRPQAGACDIGSVERKPKD